METIDKALNNVIDTHGGPTKEEIMSKLARLERLFSELERPEYREFIRFAVEWQKLDRELSALQCKINELLIEKPSNAVDRFLKQLTRKN
jgi:hypothetical protein